MTVILPEGEATVQTVALQDSAMSLSGLNLMMTEPDPELGAIIHALGDDLTLGDPEAVIAAIQSQLQDGDLERVDRYGNREAVIPLVIEAPGAGDVGDALARAAAAIDRACRFPGWTELAYTPPLAGAATSVYEVTSATVSATFDDIEEMEQGCRYLTLSIHARPFARSTTKVSIDAPPVIGSTTNPVADGSSLTGWSLLSTAPSPIKNLSPNPSFESNTTGWGASSGSIGIRRVAYSGGEGLTGAGAFKCFVDPVFEAAQTYAIGPVMAVNPNTSYALSIHVNGASTDNITQIGFLYRWYNSSGVQIGPDHTATTSPGAGNVLKRVSTVAVSPAGAASVRQYPFVTHGSGTDWVSFAMDGQQVSPGTTVPFYFDANTPDTAAVTYTADTPATPNNSTSTATWTAPTLGLASGSVKGTVYGRSSASIRRTGAVDMSVLTFMRVRGTASAYADGVVTIADNGGSSIAPKSYSYNTTTGAFDIIVERPSGFTAIDVTFARTGGAISTTAGLFVAVDQIDITNNPFATGKVQTRQVEVYGSQDTELSLSILGLDAAGTSAVGLGEQVLVHTAAADDDGRAKFLACRSAAGTAGTADSTAVSGAYNALSTSATPTEFNFPASTLLSGNYLVVARIRCATIANAVEVDFRGFTIPTTGSSFGDPITGWKSTFIDVVGAPLTSATWPQIFQNTWAMVPLGFLRLPPGEVEDPGATIKVIVFRNSVAVDLDDVFLLNTDVGDVTLIRTDITGGSYSAVRLDAASIDRPAPSAWVGVANGNMIANGSRLQEFNQHRAGPGILQVSTVTPGCTTSRVSASYYPRWHTHALDLSNLTASSLGLAS